MRTRIVPASELDPKKGLRAQDYLPPVKVLKGARILWVVYAQWKRSTTYQAQRNFLRKCDALDAVAATYKLGAAKVAVIKYVRAE